MQVRHLPDRDRHDCGVTTFKCASAHVPGFLTGSRAPISHRQRPFRCRAAQAVAAAHRRASARNGFSGCPAPRPPWPARASVAGSRLRGPHRGLEMAPRTASSICTETACSRPIAWTPPASDTPPRDLMHRITPERVAVIACPHLGPLASKFGGKASTNRGAAHASKGLNLGDVPSRACQHALPYGGCGRSRLDIA